MISHDPNRVKKYFQDKLIKKELVLAGLFTGMVICLTLLAYQIRSFFSKFKLSKRKETSNSINKITVESRLCTACKNQLSCMFNKPCNHMPTCNQCHPHDSNCLQCKEKVEKQIQYLVC